MSASRPLKNSTKNSNRSKPYVRGRPFKKGQSGNPAGKPKGALNGTTRKVKEVLCETFDLIGGVPAFSQWARRNKTDFYRIYARLIPHEVVGAGGGPLQMVAVERYVVHPDKRQEKIIDAELVESLEKAAADTKSLPAPSEVQS